MIEKIKGYLGLALKGRYLKFGEEALIKMHPHDVIFLAKDASLSTKEKVYHKQETYDLYVIEMFSKEELGEIVNKKEVAIILLTNHSLARQIKKLVSMKGE